MRLIKILAANTAAAAAAIALAILEIWLFLAVKSNYGVFYAGFAVFISLIIAASLVEYACAPLADQEKTDV